MNDREKFLIRMALVYLSANREDANIAFEYTRGWDSAVTEINVNGDVGPSAEEAELDLLLRAYQ